jgi:mRNA-degrading endonuclease RelE of RelBE toxin-antitoxin system
MNYSILSTLRFERELKRLIKKFPSLKEEFAALIGDLKNNPVFGTALGNNFFKIRLAIAS